MKAVVMTGGRGSRFGRRVEKAVLRVGGVSLLERSIAALSVPDIDSTIVASTHMSTETERLAKDIGVEVVRTSGTDYHADTLELLGTLGRYASVNVDVPFVSKAHVNSLLAACGTGSAAAVVPVELSFVEPEQGSVMIGPDGRMMVWVGLNIVSDDDETGLLVLEDGLLTVNINDDKDLQLANDLAARHCL